MNDWLDSLEALLGPAGLWRADRPEHTGDIRACEQDWRGRYTGRALAVARPSTVQQVQQLVRVCAQAGVSLVPQGGNTSLVGGSVPDCSGSQLVLSLRRLQRIRSVDPANLSLTAEAGCTLAEVQAAADAAGLLFPLSLASEGSCTLGGNLATNAGGTQVLRYGTARDLCLGLEVVTATGELWQGLSGLRKDNSGYDLRDLFIGSEGTLGIITAATMALHPRPHGRATALVRCPRLEAAVALLQRARHALDAGLTAFEVMGTLPLQLVRQHQPDAAGCLDRLGDRGAGPDDWTVLVEHCSSESERHAAERLQAVLAESLEAGEITTASLASQEQQRQALWRLREAIPLAERLEGVMVKHDIAVPTSAVPEFVARCGAALQARWPQARIVCFGHLGDGNLHYNVQPPAADAASFPAFESAVNEIVFDLVDALGGTVSAEHGIGQLRRHELARRKSPVALALMRGIKHALDPAGLFNPGRVLPD